MPVSLDEDLGCLPGFVLGSMDAESTTLEIDGEHSIRVGHMVIVAVGGEAGLGARATVGVGGTWPATSYADHAALLASGTPAATTDGSSPAAYLEDTGEVYYWDGDEWLQPPSYIYHQRMFWPKALVAVVDAVSGSTITLDTPSVVAATDAQVWVDSLRAMQDAMHTAGLNLSVPAGVFAFSSRVTNTGGTAMGAHDDYSNDISIHGEGSASEFTAPLGCPAPSITLARARRMHARDFAVRSNVSHEAGLLGAQGYGTGDHYRRPFQLVQGNFQVVERVTVIGCEWGGITFSGLVGGVMRECRFEFPTPRHYYLGIWALQFADCTDSHSYDCVVDSDYLCTGAEHFKSIRCTHNDLTLRNGQIASNSSHHSWYNDVAITVEADSARPLDHDPLMAASSTVVVDWNRNSTPNGDPQGGGIRRLTFVQEGAIGQDFQFAWLFSRASTLVAGGTPITIEGWSADLNEHFTQGVISALFTAQAVLIDGLAADGRVDLAAGSVANAECPHLRYDSAAVTLGSGNNIPLIEDVL